MAINVLAGLGDNEYQQQADQARANASGGRKSTGGGGGPSPIAVVLDLLGINHSVAKPPKPKEGDSAQTGDLASSPAAPTTKQTEVTDKKGDVVGTVNQALKQTDPAVQVTPLSMTPLSLDGDGIPRPIHMIDPNTGRPFGT